jgi:TPR repeat protein
VALHVAVALQAVHAQGLMHRDVSPDNIFITKDAKVKLIDFGAARFAFGMQNKSLSVVLKPSYAPVEQYQTRGNQGPWTDIYALGATLYRCVTGQLPPESLSRLEDDKLKPPSELGVTLPHAMEAAILKALALKAKDRFQSVQEFSDALLRAWPQPQTIAAAPGETRQIAAMPDANSTGRTAILDANSADDMSSFPSGEAQHADECAAKTAALERAMPIGRIDRTERLLHEPERTARVSQASPAEKNGEKRSRGAKKWIALAMVILAVSAGAFWIYAAMPVKSETAPPPNPDELYASGRTLLDNGDLAKAEPLLERAANIGHAKAMSALGFLHQRKGDKLRSYEWYQKAADAGDNEEAPIPLAQFYYFGEIVPKNYKKAVALLRPFADAGNVNARSWLSKILEEGGYGIIRNPKEAERYRNPPE